jgi:flavin reductase (DIM6/NTAB) family NADH-FMN oxidoreductase RutF
MAADIRPLMAAFPTGVVVITALGTDGRPWGMTCTSLCSVTLEPPTLLVCLRCGSPTLDAVLGSGSFAVNLLHDEARSAAELFASGALDRFERIAWQAEGTRGPHLIGSAHTVADCVVTNDAVVGTHTVVMGRVEAVVQMRAQRPLMYGLRRYAAWPDEITGDAVPADAWATLGY